MARRSIRKWELAIERSLVNSELRPRNSLRDGGLWQAVSGESFAAARAVVSLPGFSRRSVGRRTLTSSFQISRQPGDSARREHRRWLDRQQSIPAARLSRLPRNIPAVLSGDGRRAPNVRQARRYRLRAVESFLWI